MKRYSEVYRKLPQGIEQRKKWREKNQEYIEQYRKAYHAKNKSWVNQRSREYHKANKDRISKLNQVKNQEIKRLVLSNYSYHELRCACCGENHIDFLTIDHINGGGTQHRTKVIGTQLYRWLIKNNFPSGYQVLCFNCNCAKGLKQNNNKCPHEAMKLSH